MNQITIFYICVKNVILLPFIPLDLDRYRVLFMSLSGEEENSALDSQQTDAIFSFYVMTLIFELASLLIESCALKHRQPL